MSELSSRRSPSEHARNLPTNPCAPRPSTSLSSQNGVRHTDRSSRSRFGWHGQHNLILARHHCKFQLLIKQSEFLNHRTAFVWMMKAARTLEKLKQVQLCLRSVVLVCGRLPFDSFLTAVLVTHITGSEHEKLALLAAHRV